MGNMRFKVGDRVRIKSLDWYNENKNSDDNCDVVFADGWLFSKLMSNFCGKELIIEKISHATNPPHYIMKDTMFGWTDEMIEGLAEEENEKKLSDESWRYKNIFDPSQYPQSFECPEGYIFKDENGNVINATKIVLEKKKKEYPKTYEECAKVLLDRASVRNDFGYKGELLVALQKLLVCRDAYWKIAGEEMGLGKPWEPDWKDGNQKKYCIYNCNAFLAFPAKEMRDAFYENFKELIEQYKELL